MRHGSTIAQNVRVTTVALEGTLSVPADSIGIVLFAHGSGSSRHSPRNVYVASALQQGRIATLLFDLLTAREALDRENVFEIDLLARRLREATLWVREYATTRELRVGYFGASTGAAAALIAAADNPEISAIVSRGGRPDLAERVLHRVQAPTLLIVGGMDHGVITLNRAAYARLRCQKELSIVPGATHLFEEPGTLDRVVELAAQWFTRYLAGPSDIAGKRNTDVH